MFLIARERFGETLLVKLTDGKTGNYFSFLPEFGATWIDFVIFRKGRKLPLLDGYGSFKEFKENFNKSFKGSLLFPFPNRINKGQYTFEGKEYRLPINFPSEGHAIHGLVLDKQFKILKEKTTSKYAHITVGYNYKGDNSGFPFPYHLTVIFTFTGLQLTVQSTVENTGKTNMPIGIGWHPYFRTGGKINNLKLKLPTETILSVDEKMIPTGKTNQFELFNELTMIGNSKLDTCFIIKKKGLAETVLEDPLNKIKLSILQETGKGKYNYLQVYTPLDRNSIALEPMTCAPDAINNGMGLVVLKPRSKVN